MKGTMVRASVLTLTHIRTMVRASDPGTFNKHGQGF